MKRGETLFNILVADDQPNIRRLYQYTLEKNGYRVFTVENGEDALAVLEKEHIDVVILDVMMPKMDGFSCLKLIRDAGMTMPVLMITAKDGAEDKRRSFLLGTDDYMVKPVDEIEMLLRIKALLRWGYQNDYINDVSYLDKLENFKDMRHVKRFFIQLIREII